MNGKFRGGFNAHTLGHRLRRVEAMAPSRVADGSTNFARIFDLLGGDDRARLRRFARHQRLEEQSVGIVEREPVDTSRLDAMGESEVCVESDRLTVLLRAWSNGHDAEPCGMCARR